MSLSNCHIVNRSVFCIDEYFGFLLGDRSGSRVLLMYASRTYDFSISKDGKKRVVSVVIDKVSPHEKLENI